MPEAPTCVHTVYDQQCTEPAVGTLAGASAVNMLRVRKWEKPYCAEHLTYWLEVSAATTVRFGHGFTVRPLKWGEGTG